MRTGGYISSVERIRLEIIGRYTRIYVGWRSRRVYQDLTSRREGISGEGREKIKRALMINRGMGGRVRAKPIGKTMFADAAESSW